MTTIVHHEYTGANSDVTWEFKGYCVKPQRGCGPLDPGDPGEVQLDPEVVVTNSDGKSHRTDLAEGLAEVAKFNETTSNKICERIEDAIWESFAFGAHDYGDD